MNQDSTDFDAIMPAFREGDRDAFKRVYDKTCAALTSFVETIINNSPEAENIVSETYYDLFMDCNTMETFDATRRWLFAKAGGYAKEYVMERKGRSEEISKALDIQLETESVKMTVLSYVLEELAKLPGDKKDIYRMYFEERKSIKEIDALLRGTQN